MGLFTRKKEDTKKDVKDEKAGKEKKVAAKKAVKTVAKKKTETKSAEVSKTTKDSKKTVSKTKNAYKVLIKPLVTEKAADMSSLGKYVFEVSVNANKIEVAKAVEEVYGVKPTSVNILNFAGKKVTRGRYVGRRKDWRKAIVTLAKGKTINIYEGI